jgi:3-aminobutyryl-CoA ammonia-lyase
MSQLAFAPRRSPEVGFRLVHRRYVDHGEAHYAGNLASGGFVVSLFNDIATDLSIQVDHDEGLFASYSQVGFHEALRAGDVLEVNATLDRVGQRSRTVRFEAHVVSRARPDLGESASAVLETPLLVASALGTVVVPTSRRDEGGGESSGGSGD